MRSSWTGPVAPLTIAAVLALSLAPLRAGSVADSASDLAVPEAGESEPFPARAAVRVLLEKEAAKTKLPVDIAEAVVFVESRYDSTVIGRVGEIGLMQVKPETAEMLGFKGTTEELAKPEINIHYGVTYLAKAWRLAQGDLCRALMKYRAGHGEETMTPRATIYCNRARNRLVAMNSPFAAPGASAVTALATDPVEPEPKPASPARPAKSQALRPPARPTDVYAIYKRGTPAASRAFWTAHEARIRAVRARLEAKWRRVASR
ncbi:MULTISPECIES: transglycosylase SLT domain-containing protein [Bradyrhizobium]|uniref:transglycosylase SLT domain-containing protein n=1 Tax=Bradyrhizobium TaxID=374 RepID=UPI0020132DA3|nr:MULTISPECIES: transglycosylase SLT domain-containing protein [Bradyrhizobium]